ncbi:MAG: O-antigen ligase family protein, partial [Owenweeksia sp.]
IDNPLVGVGLNNFSQWRSAVMGTSINSHNTYLSLLAEFGFIGTLAFSIFAWRPFRYFRASRRMRTNWNIMSQYIFIGLLFFFISAFVSQFQGNRNFYLFIAIAGNALALNFSRYTERPEKVQTVQA